MKILLTGAKGFIGRHLLESLLENGHLVCACDREKIGGEYLQKFSEQLQWVCGDLLDEQFYTKLPKDIEVVCHLAARLGGAGVSEEAIWQSNVHALKILLSWFSQSSAEQFLFFSSPGVQGFGFKEAKEYQEYHPRGPYERSKVAAEEVLTSFQFRESQHYTILRPDFVYGPGDYRRLPLYRRIKRGFWATVGKGDAVLRPTYVLDVCEATLTCLQNEKAYSETFNVGGPELITAKAYAEAVAEACGTLLPEYAVPVTLFKALGACSETVAGLLKVKPLCTRSQVEFLSEHHGTDISKIERTLGFKPKVSFQEGLRRTVQWARDEGVL